MGAIPISLFDLALASLMMGGVLVVDHLLKLAMGKDIAIGTVRVFVQLYIVGFILKWVFAVDQAWLVMLVLAVMSSIAGYNAVKRAGDISLGTVVFATGTIVFVTMISMAFAMEVVIGVTPWYNPQYVIPIGGMAMNGAMNGVALGVANLRNSVKDNTERVECALAVGATGMQAIQPLVAESVRRALIPTVNSLMTAGIVQLPGMMTGQIIAGLPPTAAVRYQIIIFYLLTLVTVLSAVMSVLLYARKFFNRAHQLQKIW